MPTAPEVIVVGLGAVGSATTAALARRGVRVLGLDARRPPHDRGSSHGESRIIREAYFEHPLYVPLVRRAGELWRELEHRAAKRLVRTTGVLLVGGAGSELLAGARASAQAHGVPCEPLDAAQIRNRYPVLAPDADAVGLLEPGAGVLDPEACIEALLDEAARAGAELRFDEAVSAWSARAGAVEAITTRGRRSAARLLLCAGAWNPVLAPALPLRVERQAMHWFDLPDRRAFSPPALPVFLFEEADATIWYGVPDLGRGLKVAIHHDGAATTADELDRSIDDRDVDPVRRLLRRRLPAADREPSRSAVCMYTNTPDEHFLIDEVPGAPGVLVASACSGHGFKFASAVGEVLADRLTDVRPAFDLAPFRLDRPALRTKTAAAVFPERSEG